MKQTFALLAMGLLPVAGAYSLDRPQEIHAAILLQDSGSTGARPRIREVSASESFYSGDRFQLKVQSQRSGYIYLLLENSSGDQQLLYPYAGGNGGSNRVRANRPMTVPGNTWYRFDNNPGEEVVYVLISETPIDSLERAGRDKSGAVSPESFRALTRQTEARDDKGIEVQRDDDSPASGQMTVLRLNLSHLP